MVPRLSSVPVPVIVAPATASFPPARFWNRLWAPWVRVSVLAQVAEPAFWSVRASSDSLSSSPSWPSCRPPEASVVPGPLIAPPVQVSDPSTVTVPAPVSRPPDSFRAPPMVRSPAAASSPPLERETDWEMDEAAASDRVPPLISRLAVVSVSVLAASLEFTIIGALTGMLITASWELVGTAPVDQLLASVQLVPSPLPVQETFDRSVCGSRASIIKGVVPRRGRFDAGTCDQTLHDARGP